MNHIVVQRCLLILIALITFFQVWYINNTPWSPIDEYQHMDYIDNMAIGKMPSISDSIKVLFIKEKAFPLNLTKLNPFKRKIQTNNTTNNMVIQFVSIIVLSSACTFYCFAQIITKLVIKKCIFVFLPHEN